MRKITLSLFAAIGFISQGFGQANISLCAPPNITTTQLRAPNGTSSQAAMRACYIVTPSELAGLTVANITTFGFSLTAGTGSGAVAGTFTLYLQNTPDVTYNKGTAWSSIITGMPIVYTGNMTIPATTGTAAINLPVNFPYTMGSGLYVAFEWESNGPYSLNPATYAANSALTTGGATVDSPTIPSPTTLLTTQFRPSFLFNGVNTANNEISAQGIEAAGKVSKLFGGTQTPIGYIRNGSSVTKTNITVNLTVGGANSFTDTKTLASLAPGAIGSVTFSPFASTVSGINNMSISVAPDDIPNNNVATLTQSVTCTEAGWSPPVSASSFSSSGYGFGSGAATGGIFSFRHLTTNGGSVTAVRVAVPSFTQNLGKQLFPVLMDNTGAIIASGNTLTLANGNFNTFVNLSFSPPEELQPNTEYFIGLRMTLGNTYPVGLLQSPIPTQNFFSTPAAGGSLTQLNVGYMGMEGVFTFSNTVLTLTSAKPVICKGESVTLTAGGGATTFTWSANTGSNTVSAANIDVTPANTGNVVYSVNGTNGPTGCRTNAASVTQSVSACAGISTNASALSEINVYPNPAVSGKTKVTGLSGENTVTVYNVLGQVVFTQHSSDDTLNIDLSASPNGTYLVKIIDANKASKTVKIVNQN